MTEENQEWEAPSDNFDEEEEQEIAPEMSEPATLANIFFEPGRTFEALRAKPRFVMAALIMIALMMGFQMLFTAKMGEERMRRFTLEQLDKNPQIQNLSPEAKKGAVEQTLTINRYVRNYGLPIILVITFLLGGLLYWLGSNAMGGSSSFLRGLSTWVYSSFPPLVVSMIANFIILFFKSADEIDLAESQRGLVHANPTIFFDGKSMPVVTTLISLLDVFFIWGLFLAALGLRKTGKISSGAAWGIVLLISLIGVAFRVFGAFMSGNAN